MIQVHERSKLLDSRKMFRLIVCEKQYGLSVCCVWKMHGRHCSEHGKPSMVWKHMIAFPTEKGLCRLFQTWDMTESLILCFFCAFGKKINLTVPRWWRSNMFVLCTCWVHSRGSVTCARLCRVSLWTGILICLLISVRAGSAMCPNLFHVLGLVILTMLSFGTLLIFNNFFWVYYM
jgi:hypothetical protein